MSWCVQVALLLAKAVTAVKQYPASRLIVKKFDIFLFFEVSMFDLICVTLDIGARSMPSKKKQLNSKVFFFFDMVVCNR